MDWRLCQHRLTPCEAEIALPPGHPVSSKPNPRTSGFIWALGRLSPLNPLERNAQSLSAGAPGMRGTVPQSWFPGDYKGPTLQTARDACAGWRVGAPAAESKQKLERPCQGTCGRTKTAPHWNFNLSLWADFTDEHTLRLQLTAQEAQPSGSNREQSRPRGPLQAPTARGLLLPPAKVGMVLRQAQWPVVARGCPQTCREQGTTR